MLTAILIIAGIIVFSFKQYTFGIVLGLIGIAVGISNGKHQRTKEKDIYKTAAEIEHQVNEDSKESKS
jgi:hypothetical protein